MTVHRYRPLLPYAAAVGVVLIVAACAPLLSPHDPYAQDLEQSLLAPSAEHLLGTDRYGRDLLSCVLVGAQTTLGSALALLLFVSCAGSLIGAVSGYRGGRLDAFFMRLADLLLAFPQLVFALAIAGAFGGGLFDGQLQVVLEERRLRCIRQSARSGADGRSRVLFHGQSPQGCRR